MATGNAPLVMYAVAHLVHGVLIAGSITVPDITHRDADQVNASSAGVTWTINQAEIRCFNAYYSTQFIPPALYSQTADSCGQACAAQSECIGFMLQARVRNDCADSDYVPGRCFLWKRDCSACCGTPNYCWDDYVMVAAPAPTPAPTSVAPASATGDPHLQNVHGERFDLMVPGAHVLVSIPRGERAEKALLRVQADARRLGEQCSDMYFQSVNVTGSWAEAKRAGGFHYSVSQKEVAAPEWVAFGKVALKVIRGHADSGQLYLNIYVKHLGLAGFAVGGLLGEDDHEEVATPPAGCTKRLSLGKVRSHLYSDDSLRASFAQGTLE